MRAERAHKQVFAVRARKVRRRQKHTNTEAVNKSIIIWRQRTRLRATLIRCKLQHTRRARPACGMNGLRPCLQHLTW